MHASLCSYVKLELAEALLPDFSWVSKTKGRIVHERVLAESKSLCVGVLTVLHTQLHVCLPS